MDDALRQDLIGAVAQLAPEWRVVIHREGGSYRVRQEQERKFLGTFKRAPQQLPVVDLSQEGNGWSGQIHLGTNKEMETAIKQVFLAHGQDLRISRFHPAPSR